LVEFQRFVKTNYPVHYEFIVSQRPEKFLDYRTNEEFCEFFGNHLVNRLTRFFKEISRSKEFNPILSQTEDYSKFCKKQWESNYPKTLRIMEELTGLRFHSSFAVYLTHPSLRNGRNIGGNVLLWRHN
jgi:hypothetical protein